MIISHKYKFIFLKTRKTAGTSIEIALSKFCGANDVITPIIKEDELIRKGLGFSDPQNFNVALKHYSKHDWLKLIGKAKKKQFFNHASAGLIRDCIDDDIWNSYFKFSFERDPFDKAISRYYWSTRNRNPRPAISQYLSSAPLPFLSNWDIYTINDQIAIDFVGRYENLTHDLAFVTDKIGLPEELRLPNAKGSYRKSREHYSRVLNLAARTRIELICAKEIESFNYSWIEAEDQEEFLRPAET